jgi:hypothetical protein
VTEAQVWALVIAVLSLGTNGSLAALGAAIAVGFLFVDRHEARRIERQQRDDGGRG